MTSAASRAASEIQRQFIALSCVAAPLGFENQVAHFSDSAGAAVCLSNEMRVRFDAGMRICDGDSQARNLEDRQIGGVVAHARDCLGAERQDVEQLAQRRELV